MKTIAIVHYNLSHMGGSHKVAVNVTNELSSCFNIHLISMKGDLYDGFELNDNVQFKSFKELGNIKAAFNLNKYLLDQHIDLV